MNNDKNVAANSVILGLFLSTPMITKLITSVVVIGNNVVLLIGALLAYSMFINWNRTISLKFVLINISIITAFALSLFFNTDITYTTNYFLNFILYGTTGMLLCSVEFNNTKVMKTISIVFIFFSVLTLFVYIPMAKEILYMEQAMEFSYTIIIGVSASVFTWKHFSKIFRILISLANLVSCYYLFFLSDNRGAILALVFLFASLLLKRSKHKIFWTLVFVLLIVFVVSGLDSILDVLANSDSEMRWVSRFRRSTDVLSGREALSSQAQELISNNIFGKGIGYFESLANGSYTHNLFLQLMCEFGVFVGGAISIYIVFSVLKSLLSKHDNELSIFCICQFIPRLLLSSVYWSNPFIWIFLYSQNSKSNTNNNIDIGGTIKHT